jgi:predicted transcriptional regulator
MNKNKSNTSVRLTPEATRLLKELAKKLGVSQTAIIEMAIRKLAQLELTHE